MSVEECWEFDTIRRLAAAWTFASPGISKEILLFTIQRDYLPFSTISDENCPSKLAWELDF